MIKSINKVEICGFVGMNPEVTSLKNGSQLARLNVATNSSYQSRNGQWIKDTTWHNIILWNQLADKAKKEVFKGSGVMIIGKLSNRSYTDKNGQTRNIVEIIATDIEIVPKDSSNL